MPDRERLILYLRGVLIAINNLRAVYRALRTDDQVRIDATYSLIDALLYDLENTLEDATND